MGMFDYVKAEMPCMKCKHPLTGWQTKDTEPQWLKTILLENVLKIEGATFYTICLKCDAWNEYLVLADEKLEYRGDRKTIDASGAV